ncbi:MAG: hypothetical protein ACPG4Y_02195 [Chitinophagales bacterium]
MKKLAIVLLTMFSLSSVFSQAFQASNVNFDLGYALGSHRSAFYSPGVMFSFEKGVHKWVGVGAYVGYQYNINGGGFGLFGFGTGLANSHSIPFGAQGAFHFYQMIGDLTGKDIKQDKLDLAIKHSVGARLDLNNNSVIRFDFGTSVLARYFFTEKVGIYAEIGYPAMGNALIGAAFKF